MSVRSTRVTSAPFLAADRAAAHPAQPAPTTTIFIRQFLDNSDESYRPFVNL
jgi:hypothetical protein